MAIFTFNDIITLSARDLQMVLRKAAYYTLIDALHTAYAAVRDKVFCSVTKRTALRLKAALENQNSVTQKDSEKAQMSIIQTIKEVCESGWLDVNKCFSFPDIPVKKVNKQAEHAKHKLKTALKRGVLSLENTTEQYLRNAFHSLAIPRDELKRISRLNVPAELLPVLCEFLEPLGIEELILHRIDDAAGGPYLEQFRSAKRLVIWKSKSIPESIGKLQSLEQLTLDANNELETLPENIGNLKNLASLKINCDLEYLPANFAHLHSLKELTLSLNWKSDISVLSESAGALKNLTSLEIRSNDGAIGSIDWLGSLPSLQKLSFSICEGMKTLPDSIGSLEKLESLSVYRMDSLEQLPESIGNLEKLEWLSVYGMDSLEQLPESIGNLVSLQVLLIENCLSLKQIPESIGNLKNLIFLSLCNVPSLEQLPESIGNLHALMKLSLGELSCDDEDELFLEYFAGSKMLKELPDSIGNLKNLQELSICDCPLLERIPESIGNLHSLMKLSLADNESLTALPESIGSLKNLISLVLSGSSSLDRLPGSIVNIPTLKHVNLEKTGIHSVPASISSIADFSGNDLTEVTPQNEPPQIEMPLSCRGFANGYFTLLGIVRHCCEKARREGLLALEEELEDMDDGFFKRGFRLVIDGTSPEDIRSILSPQIEREHDYYQKQLYSIALEGIMGIQRGKDDTSALIFRLNLMVDIKDNPVDAAWENYRNGDRNAFFNIDFDGAIQPEDEREEISFIVRAMEMNNLARRNGLLALESRLGTDTAADVFEHGLCLIVDNDINGCLGLEHEYIDAALSKMVERETNPVRKNLAAAKKAAVLSICRGDNPRIMGMKLLSSFDKTIAQKAEPIIFHD